MEEKERMSQMLGYTASEERLRWLKNQEWSTTVINLRGYIIMIMNDEYKLHVINYYGILHELRYSSTIMNDELGQKQDELASFTLV